MHGLKRQQLGLGLRQKKKRVVFVRLRVDDLADKHLRVLKKEVRGFIVSTKHWYDRELDIVVSRTR